MKHLKRYDEGYDKKVEEIIGKPLSPKELGVEKKESYKDKMKRKVADAKERDEKKK